MNILFRLIDATACRSTHHKLALDALGHLRCPGAKKWQRLFLKHYATYLDGAKAPDTKFKDFRNHVLHVRDNYWGGAVKTARCWYAKTVTALAARDWPEAVYSAGVLSHYYTDPIQPFHTGQSQQESNIHRAAEWSIAKSYDEIRRVYVKRCGYPDIAASADEQWLEQMVVQGAEAANPHYETMIDHYDFRRGVKDPPAGLDERSREILAELIAHAQVGFARILERAFDESEVLPPAVDLTVASFFATLQIPIRWVTRKLHDAAERRLVEDMFAEFTSTGMVDRTLPEDDRTVRELHQREVEQQAPPRSEPKSPIRSPINTNTTSDRNNHVTPAAEQLASTPTIAPPPAPPAQAAQAASKQLRFYLEATDDVVDAPSIGPKTARRLANIGIKTVADLLSADPDDAADRLATRHISPQTVRDWQDQAKLVCTIPQIRGHDAQLLVACGWREPETIAGTDPNEILRAVLPFAKTSDGQRIIRSGKSPDLDEVTDWVHWAAQARTQRAA